MALRTQKHGSFTWIIGKNTKVERCGERDRERRGKQGMEQRREKKNTNYVQTEEHFSWQNDFKNDKALFRFVQPNPIICAAPMSLCIHSQYDRHSAYPLSLLQYTRICHRLHQIYHK